LVKHGAYIDDKDTLGRTALFYSVKQKNFDLANYFMRKGADLNTKDNEGTQLLDLLDPVSDKFLYYNILDAKLTQEAQSRGKHVISIDRKFDRTGKMRYQKVNER
jgi:ankyrin repeat protein